MKRPSSQIEIESKLTKLLAVAAHEGGTPTKLNGRSSSPYVKPLPAESQPLVLIELAELSMNYSIPGVARLCVTHIKSVEVLS